MPFNRDLFDHLINLAPNPDRFLSMLLLGSWIGDGTFMLVDNVIIWTCPRNDMVHGGDDFYLVFVSFCRRHTPHVNVIDGDTDANNVRKVRVFDRRTVQIIAREWLEWGDEQHMIEHKRQVLMLWANQLANPQDGFA